MEADPARRRALSPKASISGGALPAEKSHAFGRQFPGQGVCCQSSWSAAMSWAVHQRAIVIWFRLFAVAAFFTAIIGITRLAPEHPFPSAFD